MQIVPGGGGSRAAANALRPRSRALNPWCGELFDVEIDN